MAKLEAVYRKALRTGNFYTAVRAAEAQGRLAGLYRDRAPARLRALDRAGSEGEGESAAAEGGGSPPAASARRGNGLDR